MGKTAVPSIQQAGIMPISPDYVRISTAAALALGLKPGRVWRDARCTCINLLEHYPQGCYANCIYCGLARERPGLPEENTFIRVAWPIYPTDRVVEGIAEKEKEREIGRVCVSQVQDHRANADLIDIIGRVRERVPEVPISALINATSLDESWLLRIKGAGVDMIGVGLDAATPERFYCTRGRGVASSHDWDHHWKIIRAARRMFGPFKVNCHVVVGLGETDRDLVNLFWRFKSEQIAGYLFSFNPEPGSAMQDSPRPALVRWRRIQLVKYLIECTGLPRGALEFDPTGALSGVHAPAEMVQSAIDSGRAFMTQGCPDRGGALACNRPYGSYRPGEEFRDYPFAPLPDDLRTIRTQLQFEDLVRPVPREEA